MCINYFNVSPVYYISGVFHLVAEQCLIRHLEHDAGFSKCCDNHSFITYVVFDGFRVDDNVVLVENASLPLEIGEDFFERSFVGTVRFC